MGRLDHTAFLTQLDRRDVDLVGTQSKRGREIATVALSLQLGVGNDPDRPVLPKAVDTYDLAPAVIDADDAELRISRLGFQLGHVARRHSLAPGRLGRGAVEWIDAAC